MGGKDDLVIESSAARQAPVFSCERRLLSEYFRNHYARNLRAPPSLEQREFGFGFDKKIDFRHKAFASARDFGSFVEREAPLYMSFSAAYYRFPDAQPMEKKEFLGADLAFDLDAHYDHEGHNNLQCRHCFEKVKIG